MSHIDEFRGTKRGAGDGIRTRDVNLGKVALCQLSYSRIPKSRYFNYGYFKDCQQDFVAEMTDSDVRYALNQRKCQSDEQGAKEGNEGARKGTK